jgi:hypothetical protein
MKFKKGQSGNPNGKPKGAKNKVEPGTREWIREFLTDNREQFKKDFMKMTPRLRAQLYASLLPYDAAKQQSITGSINFEDFTDEQLDKIVDRLTQAALNIPANESEPESED